MPTGAPGDATMLARQAVAEGADLVLVLGGDGTINEVVNGMVHSPVPLGVLPGGTANVLAMELTLGSRLERAGERLRECVEQRVAVGRMRTPDGVSRFFLLMAGAGLDATVVTEVNAEFKARAGKLAYWTAGLSQITNRVEQFEAIVNGDVYRCGFALASRVRNYGGDLEIALGASLLNDEFEVVLFEGSHPLRYAWYMLGVGTKRVQSMYGVRTLRTNRIEFLGDAHVQIDGEYAGRVPACFETVPAALTLLVPPAYK